ncbi:MAG: outer membrane lipoprotein carrier protein LolA [Flavobacteriaceae bacterium]
MKINLVLILFLSLNVFAQGEKMSNTEAQTFRAKAENTAKAIQNLTTDFIQFKHMTFLSEPIETSGQMVFETPDKLLWKYTKPYAYSIIFKDHKVFINNEGNKSSVDVGNNKTFEQINKMIVGSVSGNLLNDESFSITYFKNSDFNVAVLNPKSNDIKIYISRLELYFDKTSAAIAEVKLYEPSEDFTHIVFKNKKTNVSLDQNTFTNK